MRHASVTTLLLLAFAAAAPAAAVEPPCSPGAPLALVGLGTPEDDLARVGELAGAVAPSPRVIRRGGARTEALCADGPPLPWARLDAGAAAPGGLDLRLLPLRLTTTFNSRYPSGPNDGLLWAGRGTSAMLTAGVALRAGPFSAALAPEVALSENATFEIVPNGGTGDARFANPFYGENIDLPQRFGAKPYATWAPGQSYVRVDAWNAAVGLSSENLWFGPGMRNAIAMSNAGPGFPHVFAGTSRPGDIWIGKAEALVFWGRLDRSRYQPAATHPLVSGLVLDYSPRWLPRLTVGLARVMLQRPEGLRLVDYLSILQSFRKKDLADLYDNPQGDNPNDNQLASLFFRWGFPEGGLELYGEWAREDHEATVYQVIREPDHAQAWLLGVHKVWRGPGARWVRFQGELTHLQDIRPFDAYRGMPVYYTHGQDLSYTHAGQLLGAWIGPGGSSQTLAVDVFGANGRIGGYLERIRRNDVIYWQRVEPLDGTHDAELALGARQVLFAGPVELSWDAAIAYRWTRDFLRDEPNVRIGVGLAVPLARR